MITCKLIRNKTGDDGTFGRFYVGDSGPVFYSGELPFRDNKPGLSSIPRGKYPCKSLFSPHFGRDVYHVLGVQGRDQNGQCANIEIHSGNVCGDVNKGKKSEVLGCILLGLSKGIKEGQEAVLRSREAIAQFENNLNGQDFMLEVSEEYEPTTA